MPFGNLTQFDYLYAALANKYPGIAAADAKSTAFQFMDTPLSASWIKDDDADAFELADSTSLQLGGFFVRGSNFANSYKDFILSVQPAKGSDNSDYRNAVTNIAALDNNITALVSTARNNYQLFLQNNTGTTETWDQWLTDPFGGADFGAQLKELNTQRDDFASQQAKILQALDLPLSQAQSAVNPWAQTMNITEGSAVRQVPLTTIGGNLTSDIVGWNNRAPGQYDFDVTINQADVEKYPWKTVYTVETHADCWGASSSVKVETSRIIADRNYKLRVMAVGANSYLIERGQWYHESFMDPNIPIVEGSCFSADTFFGKSGSLHLIPETIFVLYKPTIQLTISTQLFKQVQGANADMSLDWLDLMGLRFDVKGWASLQPEGDETTTTVTFRAPVNQPAQVVGVISKVAFNGGSDSNQ
ncbi:hypothetical protein [Magnetospirillum sp. UT-4]|uniref:hypothetical protein n=1 Tax=Magnetospirillum sp. UT-4 TaxID=2681467 RepID=UPI001383FCBB|nr:hypothetical protein [Magnetospirillum sp. UT-4]CAA7623617.1 putative Similarity (Modular protein) [Magnetospirillum sp. UT-4]